jgi:hypothetical protein
VSGRRAASAALPKEGDVPADGSAAVIAAATSLKWIDVLILGMFALGIVLVLLVPFTIDVILSHQTYRKVIDANRPAAERGDEPRGVQGLARACMAFAVILVVGFALAYILVKQPFSDNKTIAGNILIALTTTLASITAFYFGSRLASQAHREGAEGARQAEAEGAAGAAGLAQDIDVSIETPADGAIFSQSQSVVAKYGCTPSAGAQITRCVGTGPAGSVGSGAQLDTSQPGQYRFTVEAQDSAGQSKEVMHTYTVQ